MARGPTDEIRLAAKDLAKFDRRVTDGAAELIAEIGPKMRPDAMRRYRGVYRVRRGRSLRGIRTQVLKSGYVLILGKRRYPWLGGQEFGAPRSRTPQFMRTTRALAGSKERGLFVYAARDHAAAELQKKTDKLVARQIKKYARG